ncbi:hypothetical protein FLONG3_8364 [Fusarium longipes]|uniref:Zn(2)-C6 fungal-type domain-containing protein n=1 Tax=Fusarium longipes TaxID=694270 RepID=A0A395S659_9HYPO|nr:hypothetical protein FLONG3_8364 [Fusarium longipes]
MASNSNTLPQGFTVFQPTLGAQLQFFPAIGTRELDELVNAYIPGPASIQEKRATVSLDYLEYAHLTGQTFKFYPVYTLSTSVESPVGASPLQDSGYGSFNTSPVTSNWDWSHINTTSSRRSSPKSTASQQPADFSNLPGMKIMTKDGRDVTNSASRGSKTKEQRDHAHLMRIIKACESCKKKKIRCDPSHKKRGVSSTVAQPAKVTKKTKTATPETKVSVVAHDAFASQMTIPELDFLANLDSLTAPVEPASDAWEQFIQYPAVDDSYDFFNDPEGYLSPQSSSSISEYSAKAVTPTTGEELLRRPRAAADAEIADLSDSVAYLPFDHVDVNHDYVDFNLYSPESSFSEDERMVPLQVPKQSVSQPKSPAPNPLPPRDLSHGLSSRGDEPGDGQLSGDLLGGQLAASASTPQHLITHGLLGQEDIYRDPGASLDYHAAIVPTTSLGSGGLSTSASSQQNSLVIASETQSSVDILLSTNSNVTISRDITRAREMTTTGLSDQRLPENATTQATEILATQQSSQPSATAAAQSHFQSGEVAHALLVSQPMETVSAARQPASQDVTSERALEQPDSRSAETHNVAGDISQPSLTPAAVAPVSYCPTSMARQSGLETLAPLAMTLIASAIWSFAYQLFVNNEKCCEYWTCCFAQSQRKVNQITSGIGRVATKLQRTMSSGMTPVRQMVSMSTNLIAV